MGGVKRGGRRGQRGHDPGLAALAALAGCDVASLDSLLTRAREIARRLSVAGDGAALPADSPRDDDRTVVMRLEDVAGRRERETAVEVGPLDIEGEADRLDDNAADRSAGPTLPAR